MNQEKDVDLFFMEYVIHSNIQMIRDYLHKHYPHTWSDMFSEFDIKYSQFLEQTNYKNLFEISENDCELILYKICDEEFIEEQKLENKKEEARIRLCAAYEDFNDEENDYINKLIEKE